MTMSNFRKAMETIRRLFPSYSEPEVEDLARLVSDDDSQTDSPSDEQFRKGEQVVGPHGKGTIIGVEHCGRVSRCKLYLVKAGPHIELVKPSALRRSPMGMEWIMAKRAIERR